jgi:hypothetical protein
MTVDQAAKELHEKWRGAPWLTTIGVAHEQGRDVIVVYAHRPDQAARELMNFWQGFPVVVRKMGRIRPLMNAVRQWR